MSLTHITNFKPTSYTVPFEDKITSIFEIFFEKETINNVKSEILTEQVSSATLFDKYLIVKFNQIIFTENNLGEYTLEPIKKFFETPTPINIKICDRQGNITDVIQYSHAELLDASEIIYNYANYLNKDNVKQVVCIFKIK